MRAGNPHVRFEEGTGGRSWHTVTEPRKGKPGHRSTPPPKLCSLLLYSTLISVDHGAPPGARRNRPWQCCLKVDQLDLVTLVSIQQPRGRAPIPYFFVPCAATAAALIVMGIVVTWVQLCNCEYRCSKSTYGTRAKPTKYAP